MRTLLDLILPLECGGCGAPGIRICANCLAALTVPPVIVRPRVDVDAACWAIGPYSGPLRQAVIAAKEQGRRDLAGPLGAGLAHAVDWLRTAGELDPPQLAPLVFVPAPTRARAARRRGGDPVARMAQSAVDRTTDGGCTVTRLLRLGWGVRDSVGLSAAQRTANLAGRVGVRGDIPRRKDTNVVLVDDVLTTGATAAASVRALAVAGVAVSAVLVVAAA
ncbi:ComF family protein [Skermania sp. ID1734]|uniref:ComF family protein n=1 Tax=Skermania sp. ID1734 TaxID=2597516 RepID=UPI00117FD151|nr:ComF family protein [Skermania sp. ID1734]TSD97340.1 ComF family protein [Skermania sp. ID1734]